MISFVLMLMTLPSRMDGARHGESSTGLALQAGAWQAKENCG